MSQSWPFWFYQGTTILVWEVTGEKGLESYLFFTHASGKVTNSVYVSKRPWSLI